MTVKQFALAQSENGFNVWRSWDEPGGIRDQMYAVARNNPQLAKLVRLGTTLQGREILAVKLTQGARGHADGSRPAVLYSSTQHAREWISTEVNRRLMRWYVDALARQRQGRQGPAEGHRAVVRAGREPRRLRVHVRRRAAVAQEPARQRRRRRRSTIADGVDPNRNYPNHFRYDEEGSSSIFSSETYRGPSAVSEHETQALKGLLDRIDFSFQVNWHSAGEWLLYAEGWQTSTPTADDPIYFALSGNLDEPAIAGFHPGLSSDVLYVTNGETTDYAHAASGALAWTPELSEGCDGLRLRVPRRRGAGAGGVRAQPAVRALGRAVGRRSRRPEVGARDRDEAVLHRRATTRTRRACPGANFDVRLLVRRPAAGPGAGEAQPRRRDAEVPHQRRSGAEHADLGVGGRRALHARRRLLPRAARHGHGDVAGRLRRGLVRGRRRAQRLVHVPGRVGDGQPRARRGGRGLHRARRRCRTPGPHYLQYYLDALAANGVAADVYDVDARGRIAPDHIGVLGHYDGVIWYTGDDVVTREPGRAGGNADRLALDEIARVPRLHERGRPGALHGQERRQAVLRRATGRNAVLRPEGRGARATGQPPDVRIRAAACRCAARCSAATSSTTRSQYWFGGFVQVADDGHDDETGGPVRRRTASTTPFERAHVGLQRRPTAPTTRTPARRSSSTSGILPPDRFPQFESWPSTQWDKPGRAVRAAHRQPVRLLADRRRLVQAADARDRRARPGAAT